MRVIMDESMYEIHGPWTSIPTEVAWSVIAFFFFAEFDRRRAVIASYEASQLQWGYKSVLDAHCSSTQDEINLRAQICRRTEEVDETIRVLILAGMSTSSLREASKLGVNIKGAASIEYSFPVLMFGLSYSGRREWQRLWQDGFSSHQELIFSGISIANMVLSALFFLYFASAPLDAQVFAYRVLQKGGLLIAFVPLMLAQMLQLVGVISFWAEEENLWATVLLVWLIVIPISAARIDGIAKIPRIGPAAANFFAIRGFVLREGSSQVDTHVLASSPEQNHP